MFRGFYARLFALMAMPLLAGGCVQMTRHSNLMIFGTNTVVGLRVGTGASSVPEIALGYARQEAVILPLVANVAPSGRPGDPLVPCDLTKMADVPAGDARKYAVHPCSLVATRDGAQDSYSVLASFGGTFKAANASGAPSAEGGVSQYFATGLAAQMLALSGGAASVASSPAAEAAAAKGASPQALAALFGPPTIPAAPDRYKAFKSSLEAKIDAEPSDATVAAKIGALEAAAVIKTPLIAACATKTACKAAVDGDGYEADYAIAPDRMDAALAAWK